MEAELKSMTEAQKPQQGADSVPMNHIDKDYNDHDPLPLTLGFHSTTQLQGQGPGGQERGRPAPGGGTKGRQSGLALPA